MEDVTLLKIEGTVWVLPEYSITPKSSGEVWKRTSLLCEEFGAEQDPNPIPSEAV